MNSTSYASYYGCHEKEIKQIKISRKDELEILQMIKKLLKK